MNTFRRLILPLCMLVAVAGGISFANAQTSFNSVELDGYAWSSNIGWISMNCKTGGPNQVDICGVSNYNVSIDSSGDLVGYAWSDNIGWLKFGGLSGTPGNDGNAHYDSATGEITGFAQFCSGRVGRGNYFDINNNCGGSDRTDGWDGWLSLGGKGSYGITVSTSGIFYGQAWGDVNVGWVDFSGVRLVTAPTGPETLRLSVGAVDPASAVYIYTETFNTNPLPSSSDPATITVLDGMNLKYTYQTQGVKSCDTTGTYPASNIALPYSTSIAFSLTPGRKIITVTCETDTGATLVKSAIVDVKDEGVMVVPNGLQNPQPGQTLQTHQTLRYYSVGTVPGSCTLRSYKPSSNWPQPHNPTPGSGNGVVDWNPGVAVKYTSGLARGNQTVARPSTASKYLIDCVGSTSGKLLYSFFDLGQMESAGLILTATPTVLDPAFPKTVNVGGAVDLDWVQDFTNSSTSVTLSSCVGTAELLKPGSPATPVSVPGWTNIPVLPSPQWTFSNVPVSYVSGTTTVPVPAGQSLRYIITCTSNLGQVVSADDTIDVKTAGPVDLDLKIKRSSDPSYFGNVISINSGTSSPQIDLTWVTSDTIQFSGNACVSGASSLVPSKPPVLMIAPGTPGLALPTPGWMSSPTNNKVAPGSTDGSPNEVQNLPLLLAPPGTVFEYWISCTDINNQIHTAWARVNIQLPPPPPVPTASLQLLSCSVDNSVVPAVTNTTVGWSSTNTSSCLIPSNVPTSWTGTPTAGPTSGSSDHSFITPSFTFSIICDGDDGSQPSAAMTVNGDCSVANTGPKKPIFEEF